MPDTLAAIFTRRAHAARDLAEICQGDEARRSLLNLAKNYDELARMALAGQVPPRAADELVATGAVLEGDPA